MKNIFHEMVQEPQSSFSKLVCLDFVSFHFLNLCTMPTSISLDHKRLSCRWTCFRSQKRKRQKQWSRSRHGYGSQTAPTCLQSWCLRWVASLELVSHCDQVALDQGRRGRVCLTHNLDQGWCWQKTRCLRSSNHLDQAGLVAHPSHQKWERFVRRNWIHPCYL